MVTRLFERAVVIGGLLLVALLGALAFSMSAGAQPAAAASAPAAAASAPPVPTPNANCGEGGTGLTWDRKLVTRAKGEAADMRVDAEGHWRQCQPCLPAVNEAFRSWTVGPNACTTAVPYDSDAGSPARDRILPHDGVGFWRQTMGPMRGFLTEACFDGARRVVSAGCAPAQECDTAFSTTDDGGKTVYSYDARPADKRVPLGAYVYATSQDGKRLRLQCVAGDLVKSPEPPPPAVRQPAQPRVVTCGPQGFNAPQGLTLWHWRYAGPRVEVGAVVEVERRGFTPAQDGAGVKREAVCMPSGQLQFVEPKAPVHVDPNNPWNQIGK